MISTMACVPTSGRLDAMHLRKRALSLTRTTSTKIGGIGFRVSHIFIRPINGHQTQTKGKCPWHLGQSQRFALESKEAAKDLNPNLFASIHPSSSCLPVPPGLALPDTAQSYTAQRKRLPASNPRTGSSRSGRRSRSSSSTCVLGSVCGEWRLSVLLSFDDHTSVPRSAN